LKELGVKPGQPVKKVWGTLKQLQVFINALQEILNQISNEVQKFKNAHFQLLEIVSSISEVDIVTKHHQLEEKVVKVRLVIESICKDRDQADC